MFFKRILTATILAGIAFAAPVPSSGNVARAAFNLQNAAMAYVGKEWNVTPQYSLWFDSGVTGTNGSYAFLRQQVNDQPLSNSFATVAFDSSGNVVQFKSSGLVNIGYVDQNFPNITPTAAATAASQAFPALTYQGVPASFGSLDSDYLYVATSTGEAVWTYPLPFTDASGVSYTIFVNTLDGTIEQLRNNNAGTTITLH